MLVVAVCTGGVGTVHLLAQVAIVGVFHERSHARVMEGKYPAFFAALFGGHGCHFLHSVGKSREVFRVGHVQLEIIGFRQFVFIEREA